MRRWLKALPLALALAALSIVATSCGSSNAQVRFVNAIQNTQVYDPSDISGALNVEFNGTTQFSDVTFPSASASTYKGVPAGSPTIEGIDNASSSTVVFTQASPVSLSAGQEYTMVATGLGGGNGSNVDLEAFPDSNTISAGNGNVEFRVINASYYGPYGGRGAVDVYIQPGPFTCGTQILGTQQISGLAYPNPSLYVTLPWNSGGGGWEVCVTAAGTLDQIVSWPLNFGSQNTEAIRTLVLTDVVNGNSMDTTLRVVLNDLN
jgi:hypothetical protein